MLFGNVSDGIMIQSELGKVVDEEWQCMATIRGNVQLDSYIVMPNHFHALLVIENTEHGDSSQTLRANSLGAIVGQFKVAVNRRATTRQLIYNRQIWQRNYYDHIVRSEEALFVMRRYIVENPAHWQDDDLYVD